MRGFPIVSLGSLVGTFDACEVLIPQFEVDEYYQGEMNIIRETEGKHNKVIEKDIQLLIQTII